MPKVSSYLMEGVVQLVEVCLVKRRGHISVGGGMHQWFVHIAREIDLRNLMQHNLHEKMGLYIL